jgi:hypothetical protein
MLTHHIITSPPNVQPDWERSLASSMSPAIVDQQADICTALDGLMEKARAVRGRTQ